MKDPPRAVLAALMVLTFVTGVVDAVSVLGPGRVFTANMTGNVVFFGFALAGHGSSSIGMSLVALGGFFVGALVAGRVVKDLTRKTMLLGFGAEVVALALATALCPFLDRGAPLGVLVGLVALAMGMRNAVVRRLAIPDLTTTVLTLTVTGLAADSSLAGGGNPRWGRRVLSVVFMLGGAAVGAVLLGSGLLWAMSVATALEAVAVALLVRTAPEM